MKDLCRYAVEVASQKGASFVDARIVRLRDQRVSTEDLRVSGIQDTESIGIGVRVIAAGAWGFAASSDLDRPAIARVAARAVEIARASALALPPGGLHWAHEDAHVDTFQTPVKKDPFAVPLEEKTGLLLNCAKEVLAVAGVKKCHGLMHFKREERYLANSEGSLIESVMVTSTGGYEATAVDAHTAKTRYFEAYPLNAGYEHIDATPLLAEAQRTGSQAVEKLRGKPGPIGKRDLVLHPSNLALTMHESIGHATELDRVLGMEESLAGSSFATLELLGKLKYGSPLMTILADNTLPYGLASRGYDDDAVAAQAWPLIQDGILVDYQTSREVCHAVGAPRSHGSCRADTWGSIPIIRQSNLGLAPGKKPLTL